MTLINRAKDNRLLKDDIQTIILKFTTLSHPHEIFNFRNKRSQRMGSALPFL